MTGRKRASVHQIQKHGPDPVRAHVPLFAAETPGGLFIIISPGSDRIRRGNQKHAAAGTHEISPEAVPLRTHQRWKHFPVP